METKKCSRCGEEKDLAAFVLKNRALKKYHSFCKACKRVWSSVWYSNNKKKQIAYVDRRTALIRDVIREAKSIACADCGRKYHWYLMDFDHLRDKVKNVSQMMRGFTVEQVRTEIAKCDVICSLCHRVRTWNRRHPDCLLLPEESGIFPGLRL